MFRAQTAACCRSVGLLTALLTALLASTLTAQAAAQGIDCSRITYCTACSVRRVGTVSRLFCSACSAGYAPSADGRSCVCAPGFYWDSGSTSCQACGLGAWCPGGSDQNSRGSRTACGTNMTTTTSRARYATQCLPEPGTGLSNDNVNAQACTVGFYSYGLTRKPCTPCPRTFTTTGTGASSKWQCACPPGYKYVGDSAVPCGYGFWKASTNFALTCTACGTGLTTASPTSSSASDCALAKSGYRLTKSGDTVTGAVACGTGYYSAGGDITSCTQCPAGTVTSSATAPAASACMPMAGYAYNMTSSSVYACPIGSYKFGVGAYDCTSCGTGLLTTSAASTSYSDCYIPTGWGATVVTYDPLLLSARRCTDGTYGVSAPVYGPKSDNACQKCPLYMTTQDTNQAISQAERDAVVNSASTACLTTPGYGYNSNNNTATPCPGGTTNSGYNRDPCT